MAAPPLVLRLASSAPRAADVSLSSNEHVGGSLKGAEIPPHFNPCECCPAPWITELLNMDPDELMSPIDDYSPATLEAIRKRLALSFEVEHMIYRESELDEVWRLLDADINNAARDGLAPEQMQRLCDLRSLIVIAHDRVGNDGDTLAARDSLQRAIALQL